VISSRTPGAYLAAAPLAGGAFPLVTTFASSTGYYSTGSSPSI
jgi:hypothetical protein